MSPARDPVTGRRYKLSIMVDGKRKYTMLYRRWMDMKGRTKGHSTRSPELYTGLKLGWKTFAEFRSWALRHGFSKRNSSPDRQDASKGYEPGNVEFVSCKYNTHRALLGDDYYRGEEPPHDSFCDCDACIPGFGGYRDPEAHHAAT